jgi:radical SAM superfamily enzyme YgiQ (UPF0313 family)
MEEIGLRIGQYYKKGMRFLYLFDDTFILSKDFVIEFCRKFIKKGFHKKIKWTANVRANLVTDEIIKIMKDAGCYEARMGVESGNDYILNTVYKRNMSKKQLIDAFKIIKKNGMQLRLDFIIGAPYETLEMMQESFDLARLSNADQVFFAKLYPFPGTEIKEICEKEHSVNVIEFKERGMPPVNRTKFISEKQLDEFARKIRIWQMQMRLHEGFSLKNIFFLFDVLIFILYYKPRYNLEQNQMYRWNIQRYKLLNLETTLS